MKKRMLSLLLVLVMVLGMFPTSVLATNDTSITVYVTISKTGVLATAKDGAPMGYRAVTVTDQDDDGKLTIYDAYTAAHNQYCDSEFMLNGAGVVGKLWGVVGTNSTYGFLTFVNNTGISGIPLNEDPIRDGDHLVGAILSATDYWSDYYSFFDSTVKEIGKGDEFILTLKGRTGMSSEADKALSGISVGTWENESFSAISGKTTDANGSVTLSFDTAGTYYVTASGSVQSNNSTTGRAPIIAPVCIVTVTEEKTDAEYVATDKDALNVTYTHGQNLTLPGKGQSGKTTITWNSGNTDVISNDGVVTLPEADITVTLTATITCNETNETKEIQIPIPGRLNAAKAVLEAATLRPVEFTNATDAGYQYFSAAKDTNILDVARAAVNDSGVEVALADSFTVTDIIAAVGTITYPTDAAKEITLPLKLTYNGENTEVRVSAVIPKHAYTKTEEIEAMKAALAEYMNDPKVLNGNESLDKVMTTLLLPGGKSTGLWIKWSSSNTKVIANQTNRNNIKSSHNHPTAGYYEVPIMRPGGADAEVTLTAEFKYQSTSVDIPAGPMPSSSECKTTITVKVPALTEDERKDILDGAADDVKLFDKDGAAADITNIKDNLYFPSYDGFTTKWSTNLTGLTIPASGYGKATVTRPEKGAEDQTGTITLKLTAGDVEETRTFEAEILAWTEEDLNAAQSKLNQVAEALTFDRIDKDDTNASANAVTNTLWLYRSAGFAEGEQVESNPVNFEVYNKTTDLKTWPVIIDWTITPSNGPIAFNANQPNKGATITAPSQDTEVTLKATINYRTPISGVNAVEKTIAVTVLSAETALYRGLMDNIAAKYAASGVAGDANAPWLAADMAAYLKLFPDTANKLSAEQKQAMVDKAIENLATATAPGDAAKYILSLVAMGYDPAQLTTAKGEALNAVETLNTLSFDASGNVTDAAKDAYTLSYVIIAYQQLGSTYQTQLDRLVDAAVATRSDWMNTEWGADAATPMVLALAPYSGKTAVAAVLDEARTAISGVQIADGSLSSFDSGSAASTGLGIAAYAALGTDPKAIAKDGKHLLDGLMAYKTDGNNGFTPTTTSHATEQSFRGLIAYYGFKSGSPYYLYNFSGQTLVPAAATPSEAVNCTVQINTTPAEATVVVKQGDTIQTALESGAYDLAAGEYTYTVSCSGYTTKTGTFTVSADDVTAGTKTISVSLTAASGSPESGKINTTISVINPNGGYFQSGTNREVTAGTTVSELLLSLGLTVVSNSHAEYGFYVESINGVGEFDHGSGSGWMFKVNGEFPDASAADYVLQEGDVVEWVYTRDLGVDVGAGSYQKPLTAAQKAEAAEVSDLIGAIGTVTKESGDAIKAARAAYDALSPEQQELVANYDALVAAEKKYAELTSTLPFNDVSEDDYYYEAVKWAAEKGITSGTSETTFSPHASCTRAQMVTFLWRAAGSPEPIGAATAFIDVDQTSYYYKALLWAVENSITSGTSATTFSPDAVCTRGQMAMFLYRSAKNPAVSGGNSFDDVNETAYYKDAVLWAKSEGITAGTSATTFSPDTACTRAQMVTFLYRYLAE